MSPILFQLVHIISPTLLQLFFIMSPTLLQLAFILSPTAVILLLVVLVYGWVAPPPVAPSEPFGSLVEVNGSFSYHEKNIDEEQEDQELGMWSLSLAKLYSPQVILGEEVTTVRKQKLKESKSLILLLALFQFYIVLRFFQPWMNALILHIYSLGLWSGVLPTIGSHLYNNKTTIVR